jgi:hypothetical protein
MLAALILGLKRQSARWPGAFHWRDYGTFLPARDFSYSIWNSDTKRETAALPAATIQIARQGPLVSPN